MIAFNIVWGLGSRNNFAQQGIVVITSWILLLIIYFIPYTLMVGQLGSTFKDSEPGLVTGLSLPQTASFLRLGPTGLCRYHIWLSKNPQTVLNLL